MTSSPLAPPSPTSSQGSLEETNLEQLVEYLLASKRSLQSITLVWRARDIVDCGRIALEENAALRAKNAFVSHAVNEQIEVLEAIRHGTDVVDAEASAEYEVIRDFVVVMISADMLPKATVQSLDKAAIRLHRTIDTLRTTMVEKAFRPPHESPKQLFDFVDEAGIDQLENSIRTSMDNFEIARGTFSETCEQFQQDLLRLHHSLHYSVEENTADDKYPADSVSPMPGLFYALEAHATESATHLEGLVRHYDLCVTALKHTEGGGEAISQASDGEQEQQASALAGLGVDLGKFDDVPPQPMGEEERRNMLMVLGKDAVEVEDVVLEIKDRVAEMEDQLGHVQIYLQTLRDASARLRNTLSLLKLVASKLPSYITACSDFQAAWGTEKASLQDKIVEMEELKGVYSGFAGAYDRLIVEVTRRRHVKRVMDKVLTTAMAELDSLYQVDIEAREHFRIDQAEYIPSDLWPDLVSGPARYQIMQVEDGSDEIPEINQSVYERALQRTNERAKAL